MAGLYLLLRTISALLALVLPPLLPLLGQLLMDLASFLKPKKPIAPLKPAADALAALSESLSPASSPTGEPTPTVAPTAQPKAGAAAPEAGDTKKQQKRGQTALTQFFQVSQAPATGAAAGGNAPAAAPVAAAAPPVPDWLRSGPSIDLGDLWPLVRDARGDGLEALELVKTYGHQADTLNETLDMLRMASFSPGQLQLISDAGGVELVLSVMRAHPKDHSVQYQGCGTLEYLVSMPNITVNGWKKTHQIAADACSARNWEVAVAAGAASVVQNAALLLETDGRTGEYLYGFERLRPLLELPSAVRSKLAAAKTKAAKEATRAEKAAARAELMKHTKAQEARAKCLGLGQWLGQQLKKARGAKKEPALVTLCRAGDAAKVQAYLSTAGSWELESSRQWVEQKDNWGRPGKEWTWHGDTPLIAAARVGRAEVVRMLLLAGAKLTDQSSCEHEDEHWTSTEAAANNSSCAKALLEAVQSGSFDRTLRGGCKHEGGCCYHWHCIGSCHSYASAEYTWHFFPDRSDYEWSDEVAAEVATEIWLSAADAQTTVPTPTRPSKRSTSVQFVLTLFDFYSTFWLLAPL